LGKATRKRHFWIAKGDRVPTVGYKPQIARSPNGLVTAMLVPEGNAADSAMCLQLADAAVVNTGVVPTLASFDDGYASAVESLMFCLKHGHEFGQLRRRGLDAVGAELTGKAIVYNRCRIIMLSKGKGRQKPDE